MKGKALLIISGIYRGQRWYGVLQNQSMLRPWKTWTWTFKPTWKFWPSSVVGIKGSISWIAVWTMVRTGKATFLSIVTMRWGDRSPLRSKRSRNDLDLSMHEVLWSCVRSRGTHLIHSVRGNAIHDNHANSCFL